MVSINFRNESAKRIDEEKRRLEASVANRLKSVFRNMSNDASNLYKLTGTIDSQALAINYQPEFLKEIRDAMRRSIRKFGFSLRETLEKKHAVFFDIETKKKIFDLDLKQTIIIEDDDVEDKLDAINEMFLADSTIFVANESEEQAELVTQTNSKMIDAAVAAGVAAFVASISSKQREAERLASKLPNATLAERGKIVNQINRINRQIQESNKNQQAIVGENIRTNMLDKSQGRSELIAEQNVGLSEAWSRQKEAELIDNAGIVTAIGAPVSVNKEWVAILDSRTREEHVAADGQVVNVNQSYSVGGESLRYPRDPAGSPGNIMRCRCVSDFAVDVPETRSHDINLQTKEIEEIDLKPTESMAKVAKRALDWRKEFERGGTRVGIARARDISARKNLSPKTIGRMVSFFARHEVDKEAEGFNSGEEGFPSNGRIAWDLWGGDPGKSWSNKKWNQIKKERKK